jgi:hypothetical protein
VTTVPYIVGNCMRSSARPAAVAAFTRGRGAPPSEDDLLTIASHLSTDWSLADVERMGARVDRRTDTPRYMNSLGARDLAVAHGELDGAPGVDRISAVVDRRSGTDALHVHVETACLTWNCGTPWAPVALDLGVWDAHSVGIATADLNSDGRDEVVVSAIEERAGNDAWRVAVGRNCARAAGCEWASIQTIDAGTDTIDGGGVAAGMFTLAGVGVVVGAIERNDFAGDRFRYATSACDAAGRCTFAPVLATAANGWDLIDGDIAAGQLDADLVDELVISGIEAGAGGGLVQYAIASSCSETSCTFAPPGTIELGGDFVRGGGLDR